MKIVINIIPHNKQRYNTCGDWKYNKRRNLRISVSEMGNWKYEILVALHEMIEAILCKDRGIKEKEVTRFDVRFEKDKQRGLRKREEEPGFAKGSPYKKEHAFADRIERMLAKELGVNWQEYDNLVVSL